MKKISFLSTLLCGLFLAQAANAAPTLRPATAAAIKKAVAAQRGKVVLLNFWATWCPPCVAELPELVKLQKRYGGKGLRVIFVSMDEASTRQAVAPRLQKSGVTGTSWITAQNPNTFFDQFEPNLKGAIALPRTYIYNRQGKLVSVGSRESDFYRYYEKLVKPLL